jgi:hypothetical protein
MLICDESMSYLSDLRIYAIDNIFIDTTKIDKYDVIPAKNGFSDHDAQTINLN